MDIDQAKLKPFVNHGIIFEGTAGKQHYGDCPFCGKSGKFYVNRENSLWDCKRCGRQGNQSAFLSEILGIYQDQLVEDKTQLRRLARDRRLPVQALSNSGIGKHGNFYVLPVYNQHGYVQDLRMYKLGQKMRGTSGCTTGLLNLQKLMQTPEDHPVYLCEGEWDTLAMEWMLEKLKLKGVAVGVPGANTFKQDWVPFMSRRKVYVTYDNDQAGEMGEHVVLKRLRGTAAGIYFVHWLPKFPTGYDLRDFIATLAVRKKKPRSCFRKLTSMYKTEPRSAFGDGSSPAEKAPVPVVENPEDYPEYSIQDVIREYKKMLKLDDVTAIIITLATVLSTRIDGDSCWVFLVAPPGGSKTEILNGLVDCPYVYHTSSLTTHTLISGMNTKEEASLIPILDKKTLLVKDFTSILSKRTDAREEIFGQLRDAYDGYCGADFGTGAHKKFKSKFTVLAGVTPIIDQLSYDHQSLGERFMKVRIGDNLNHLDEDAIIDRAIQNLTSETEMRENIKKVVKGFIYHRMKAIENGDIPTLGSDLRKKCIGLAKYCARLRGVVKRDPREREIMTMKPTAELGTRSGKVSSKLAVSIACGFGRKEVIEEDYTYVKKVIRDTVPQKVEDVVRYLYFKCPAHDDYIDVGELAKYTRYNKRTMQRALVDLFALNIVTRSGKNNRYYWRLSDYVLKTIKDSEIYNNMGEDKFVRKHKVLKVTTRKKKGSKK